MDSHPGLDLVSWTFMTDNPDWDKPILVDAANPDRFLTYRQTRRLVRTLVAGLVALGVCPGDTVVVNGFNSILYYPLFLAIVGCGAVFTGVNPSYTVSELTHHFILTRARFVIVQPGLVENSIRAAECVGIARDRIVLFGDSTATPSTSPTPAGIKSWPWLLSHGLRSWIRIQDPYTTVASFASTSGTTGLPKAAVLSHAYHIAQAELRISCTPMPYQIRRLAALPPFHAFAAPIVPASIRQQATVYVMNRLDSGPFLRNISRYQITETYIPTPLLITLPQHDQCTPETMRSIRKIWVAGAASRAENQAGLIACLDTSAGAQINQVWGMTEAGWITASQSPGFTPPDDSVGTLLDGFEIVAVDDRNEVVEPGEVGELLIRCPTIMLGYQSNPDASRDAFLSLPIDVPAHSSRLGTCSVTGTRFRTGPANVPSRKADQFNSGSPWLRTGDVGYVKDGKVYIIDRKKEIIKVRGWQVSPAEVECVISTCPGVREAAVVGIKVGTVDEQARAFVVRQPDVGDRLDGDAVKSWVSKRLAKYKIPDSVVFVDSIEKTSTGKVLRQALRDVDANSSVGPVMMSTGNALVA